MLLPRCLRGRRFSRWSDFGWWLLAPLGLFIAALSYHQRIMRRMEIARRAVTFYERAIEKVDGKWAGHGDAGAHFPDPQHPYADDLDLFVEGGLFELLSSARTPGR